MGMKLEAVDRKNPHFICPATIGEVRGSEVLVTFDGWRGAFDYWCRFDSRDIFPVGWCSLTGDNLQPPGTKGKGPSLSSWNQDPNWWWRLPRSLMVSVSPPINLTIGRGKKNTHKVYLRVISNNRNKMSNESRRGSSKKRSALEVVVEPFLFTWD